MNKKQKTYVNPRKLLTLTTAGVLMLSLASCGGSKDSAGNLNYDDVYTTSGQYDVTYGELWEEFKWSASSVLTNQISNVIVNDQINKISEVMKKDYSTLNDEEKAEYDKIKNKLIDYVLMDIYDLTFSVEVNGFWDQYDDLEEINKLVSATSYANELYVNYRLEEINGTSVETIVKEATEENPDGLLLIANELSDVYYPQYANELFAEEKLKEKIEEAKEEDEDSEDDKDGYYENSKLVSEFKEITANQFDLNMILTRFSSEDEFNKTMRAFGIKIYNNKLYYLADNEEMTYDEYCTYYDDFKDSKLNTDESGNVVNISTNQSLKILELYIQIHNYVYGGYKDSFATSLEGIPAINTLDDLRKVTNYIVNLNYTEENYNATIEALDKELTTFSRDFLQETNSSIVTYLYETLDLENVNYSTKAQSGNNGFYIAYKFGEGEDTKYNKIYNKSLTSDEIIELINAEENAALKEEIITTLIREELTTTQINSYVNDAKADVKVKIYNEATEISYLNANSSYSKTLGSNKNKNVLATIEYNDVKWNLNIAADSEDENSIKVAGKDEAFGVFDYLEKQSGQTTALDLMSKKVIKDSQEYADSNKDRELFVNLVENVLYNFSNEGYSSSGYPSSIGKYNFMMLYFHSADIDDIIDNYYRVQYSSVSLLTDYSSKKIINFFKEYSDNIYENYFSISGTRLVAYVDFDEDGKADEIPFDTASTEYADSWVNTAPRNGFDMNNDGTITDDEKAYTYKDIAKTLIYEFYNEINTSTDTHANKIASLIEDFNSSAMARFDENPILVENQWARYRYVGLNVKSEDFSITNSSLDFDFKLKQRVYDYYKGYTDNDGIAGESEGDKKYQYFINDTTPTEYIEPLNASCVNADDDQIVETKDGYNLILVNTAGVKASAEWSKDENESDLLEDIKIKYNESIVTIKDVYNEDEILNYNQIMLFALENAINGTSSLTPVDVLTAIDTFLAPVITRYTASESQRVVLLSYIEKTAGKLTFTKEGYNDSFEKYLDINKVMTDEYKYLYNDITNTSENFPDWWEKLDALKEGK